MEIEISTEFRLVSGETYEVFEIKDNGIWAMEIIGSYPGGCSLFKREEIERLMKYWK